MESSNDREFGTLLWHTIGPWHHLSLLSMILVPQCHKLLDQDQHKPRTLRVKELTSDE